MKKTVTNVAASVHARLRNRAKSEDRRFDELLQYYAMEKFLYRLSQSKHADQFVLKGALMLQLWGGPLTRATRDIDLLGRGSNSVEALVAVVKDAITSDVPDDGLHFDTDSVAGEKIRIDARYDGVRLRFRGFLGKARVVLQVDVGFGDVITPKAKKIVYPSLLGTEGPKLLGYTQETTIAEKFEAMVLLDMANTRMKDFFDVWMLSHGHEFSGATLARAIRSTFERRQTPLPQSTPVALTTAFYNAPVKQEQWRAYVNKSRIKGDVPSLAEVAAKISAFLLPIVEALVAGTEFDEVWRAGGPWKKNLSADEQG